MTRDVTGLHAQLLSSAQLSAWARMNLRADDILDALWTDRTLARTWAMRGTLHLLPAEEVSLHTAARGTDQYRKPHWLNYYGLTERDLDALIDAVATALSQAGVDLPHRHRGRRGRGRLVAHESRAASRRRGATIPALARELKASIAEEAASLASFLRGDPDLRIG